jgi:hypothetical protein
LPGLIFEKFVKYYLTVSAIHPELSAAEFTESCAGSESLIFANSKL